MARAGHKADGPRWQALNGRGGELNPPAPGAFPGHWLQRTPRPTLSWQVFLLAAAVPVEMPQPAPGPGPGGSSQERNTASTWLTRYQSTHVAISFHLVRTTGSNPTTTPQNHRDSLLKTPVPWETLIQKVWVETGYLLCKKHHR